MGRTTNNHPNAWFNNWEDGNGSGSEKMDAYHHLAWASKDQNEFYTRARQPLIKAWNMEDKEPVPKAEWLQTKGKLRWQDYWQLEDWNSNTADEFNRKAAKPWLPASNYFDVQP